MHCATNSAAGSTAGYKSGKTAGRGKAESGRKTKTTTASENSDSHAALHGNEKNVGVLFSYARSNSTRNFAPLSGHIHPATVQPNLGRCANLKWA